MSVVDPVNFGRHHRDHFPGELKFLFEAVPVFLRDSALDVVDYALVKFPGLLEVLYPLFPVAAHQFGCRLCDVDFRVDDAAVVLLVARGVCVLEQGMDDLFIVSDALLPQLAGRVDLFVAWEPLGRQGSHPQAEQIINYLRYLHQNLLPGCRVRLGVQILQQRLKHLPPLLQHAHLSLRRLL